MKKLPLLLAAIYIAFVQSVDAKYSNSRRMRSRSSYTKKAPYAGIGKKSSANGLIKAKGVSGHGKRTSKGYTYVNPYARSK